MDEPEPTIPEVIDAWRDAYRAAVLTHRLVDAACEAVDRSGHATDASAEIARLAEATATVTGRAADRALGAGDRVARPVATGGTGGPYPGGATQPRRPKAHALVER